MSSEDRYYSGGSCGSASSAKVPSAAYPATSLGKVNPFVELVRERVVIDGITLTRNQIARAVQAASTPEPKTLNTSGFTTEYFKLGDSRITVQNRMLGKWQDKGLFLDAPPAGYEWALINDDGDLYFGARVLVIRPITGLKIA